MLRRENADRGGVEEKRGSDMKYNRKIVNGMLEHFGMGVLPVLSFLALYKNHFFDIQ